METQNNQNEKKQITFDGVMRKTGEFICELVEVTGKAVEDLTGLMAVHTDKPLRDQLDTVVEAGAARTRAEAFRFMADAGLQVKQGILSKVEKTRAEIDALKQGLKQSLDM